MERFREVLVKSSGSVPGGPWQRFRVRLRDEASLGRFLEEALGATQAIVPQAREGGASDLSTWQRYQIVSGHQTEVKGDKQER